MALEKKSTLQSIQEMFSGTSICREYLKSEKCIGPGFPLLPTPPRPQPEWLAEAGISHPIWSPGACSPQPSPWGQPEAPAEDGEPNSDSPLSSTNCSLNGSSHQTSSDHPQEACVSQTDEKLHSPPVLTGREKEFGALCPCSKPYELLLPPPHTLPGSESLGLRGVSVTTYSSNSL